MEMLAKLKYCSGEAIMFSLWDNCRITLSSVQAHFKHEQPHVLSPDSHVTIGVIQQIQDAANVH